MLRIGERLTLELALPQAAPETLSYTVLDWAPDMQVHLRTKLYGGLLTATRYMEIEKLGEQSCIFSNGEIFGGLAASFMPVRLRRALRQGFMEAGEALKARAEGDWAARAA